MMALVSEGCVTPQRPAARVKFRSSQSARKYRICCICMAHLAVCLLASEAAIGAGFGG
jgi:hypothetical protein